MLSNSRYLSSRADDLDSTYSRHRRYPASHCVSAFTPKKKVFDEYAWLHCNYCLRNTRQLEIDENNGEVGHKLAPFCATECGHVLCAPCLNRNYNRVLKCPVCNQKSKFLPLLNSRGIQPELKQSFESLPKLILDLSETAKFQSKNANTLLRSLKTKVSSRKERFQWNFKRI